MDPNPEPLQISNPLCRQPSCSLEKLPAEALVAILSASDSLTDLHAFIHASPLIYECFLFAKKSIILNIIKKDLGPAIRDAIAISLIEAPEFCKHNAFWSGIQKLYQYDQIPTGWSSMKAVNNGNITRLVQVYRVTQIFVDLYASTMLLEFERSTDVTWPLTLTERYRFAQGLLRYQLSLVICRKITRTKAEHLSNRFCGHFAGWEMEQILEAHQFILRRGFYQSFQKAVHPGDTPIARGSSRWEDLSEFGKKLLASYSTAPRAAAAIRSKIEGTTIAAWWEVHRITRVYEFPYLSSTNPDFKLFTVQRLENKEEPFQAERNMPRLTAGVTATDPPYGWVDALEGLDCRLWGKNIVPPPPPGMEYTPADATCPELEQWRRMGFMFWDKDRVEYLKTHSAKTHSADFSSGYETGWLRNVEWDPSGF